mmetsp:Transcript_51656/g.58531  ORF Transcript_51656/g.58531 Transcript_51656/m.58531 type:complete len:102 (-) Transcript_51656:196-501(-)
MKKPTEDKTEIKSVEMVTAHQASSRGDPLFVDCGCRKDHRSRAAGTIDEYHCQGYGDLSTRSVLPIVVPGDAEDTRRSHGQTAVFLHEGLSSDAQDRPNET